MKGDIIPSGYLEFLGDLKLRVKKSRYQAVKAVNQELILIYHYIGTEILSRQKNLGWGAKVIDRLSFDLKHEFPEIKGFSTRNLKYMRRFAEDYPNIEFVQQVAAQLPWFHLVNLLDKVKTPEERNFYIVKAIENGWSRSMMLHQIDLGLYNRQGKALTNFNQKLAPSQSDLANYTLKDPYIFDFLSISENAKERDIELSLIHHMEKFLIELGAGFAFVGRQYKIEVGNKDYYIDLLFYHLKLRSFVVIELKSEEFKPEYAGKINFYLSAVDDLVKHTSDNPSIGIILCRSKDHVLAEYALRDMSKPIGLAEYRLTEGLPENIKSELPTIEELEAQLLKEYNKQ